MLRTSHTSSDLLFDGPGECIIALDLARLAAEGTTPDDLVIQAFCAPFTARK